MASDVAGLKVERAFQRRLNELFADGERAGTPVTNRQLAAWMTEHGYAVKEAYISALRLGFRSSPSLRIIEGIAAFFGVGPADLLDDHTEDDSAHRMRALLRDGGVEAFALRAEGLSARNVEAVSQLLDRLREAEGLPPVGSSER